MHGSAKAGARHAFAYLSLLYNIVRVGPGESSSLKQVHYLCLPTAWTSLDTLAVIPADLGEKLGTS